jgi:hypothetical protein
VSVFNLNAVVASMVALSSLGYGLAGGLLVGIGRYVDDARLRVVGRAALAGAAGTVALFVLGVLLLFLVASVGDAAAPVLGILAVGVLGLGFAAPVVPAFCGVAYYYFVESERSGTG